MRSLLVRSILLTALTAIMAATTANVAADDSRSAYQAQIDEIERRDGTEHIDLLEPHVGLGFAAKRDLDYAAAAAAFAQALYLERVHKGLENADQIALIEQLIECQKAVHDWGAANKSLTLMAWVNERNRERSRAAYLSTLRKLANWHIHASDEDPTVSEYEHLRAALDHIDSALASAADENAIETLEWYYLKAGADYRATRLFSAEVARDFHQVNAPSYVAFQDFEFGDAIYARNRMTQHYASGIGALKSARAIAATTGDADDFVRATLKLADWHQLFGRTQSSAELYAEANRLAANAGMSLSQSHRRLPDFIGQHDQLQANARADRKVRYVHTRFDVDRKGRARNVEILEINPPGAQRLGRQARAQLKATRFRPRFEDQGPQETTGVELRFVFPEHRG